MAGEAKEDLTQHRDAKGNPQVCLYNQRSPISNGVFFGDNPFKFVFPVTLFQVFLVTFFAQVIYFVLRPIKTPRIICLALAGILVGPSFLGHIKAFKESLFLTRQTEVLKVLALMGIAYMIFIVALKMDVVLTLRSAKRTWKLGIIPFFFSLGAMMGIVHIYPPETIPGLGTPGQQLFMCSHVSFCNFSVISQALLDLNLITSELGQIALSSAMVNDILHLTYIVATYLHLNKPKGTYTILLILSSFLAFMASCVCIVRPALLWIAKTTPMGKPVRKVYVVMILLSVLVMAFITDFIGLTFLYGPLIMGLMMPNGPPLGTTIIEKSEALIDKFFLPLYVVYVGFKVDVFTSWHGDTVLKVNSVITAGYVAKVLGCVLIALTYKIRLKHGLVLGLILNMKGIIEIVIYTRLKRLKMIDDELFAYSIFSVLATTIILHPIVKCLYKPHTRLDNHSKRHHQIRTIQSTYRNPEFSIICCVYNEGNVRSLISLIEACNPMMYSSVICAYVVHFVELLGKSTPFLLPVDIQRQRLSSSFNYPITNHIMRAFDNYSSNIDRLVTILPYINMAPYRSMHESVCNLAQDKLVSFLIVPFHENDRVGHVSMANNIRQLNSNFHMYSPCTVGIIVDRYSQLSVCALSATSGDPCFHVAVFFIGGADDREALALGNRMTERANLKMTLFWFVVKEECHNSSSDSRDEYDENDERVWDESAIDEFKVKNIGNGKVVCEEIVVEDGIRLLGAIRGLERNYDLVMVGRRHRMEGLSDKEMSNFMEDVETLGVIGDMLSSAEFCNGMVPVLVLRCGVKPASRFENLDSIAISGKNFR